MAKTLKREGHRQRLRDLYTENGVGSLPDHNVVELILTYAIPRKDVKDIAYDLMNRFDGKIENILNADAEDLKKIDGIGESAAVFLNLFRDVINLTDGETNRKPLNNFLDKKEFALKTFKGGGESLNAVFIDNSDKVICFETVATGEIDFDKVDLKSVVKSAVKYSAPAIMLVHNKPCCTYKPNETDLNFISNVSGVINSIGLMLDDYIIIGRDGAISAKNDVNYFKYFNE